MSRHNIRKPTETATGSSVQRSVIALAGKPAAVEKGLFFRRRSAAENAVSVRKAPEPADNVRMFLGIAEVFGIVVGAKQVDAAQLIGQIFRMHEWQIQELQQGSFNAFVGATGKRAVGDVACERVA